MYCDDCNVLWYTVVYCGILWYTMGILWYTMDILWYTRTVIYNGYTMVYCNCVVYVLCYGSVLCYTTGFSWGCLIRQASSPTGTSLSTKSTLPNTRYRLIPSTKHNGSKYSQLACTNLSLLPYCCKNGVCCLFLAKQGKVENPAVARCVTEAFSTTCALHIQDCAGGWLSRDRASQKP